ncbi:MAG: B12-binding domain-containing radical SAM protein [Oscillospiraceae bacterium]|jgi:radical SAM superfamily enzyme YgiQ (UPF0313 family)|nr:B12-binding domain-containing radical SAM protein [Oscillospiraceae bacterium]
MKVVLLAINAKYVHSSLSVWILAEAVRSYSKKKHDVVVLEATINQELDDILKMITEQKPDVIGVSTYIWNAKMLPNLLDLIKQKLPSVTIVLGGPEASFNVDFWLENGADFVIQGEGEQKFPKLLDELGIKEYTVRGIAGQARNDSCFRVDLDKALNDGNYQMDFGKACNDGIHLYTYLDPYTDEYFSALKGRLSYIEASRGCSFSCSFCLSAENDVKYFPLDLVKKQIDKLSQSDTHTIKFVDRTFNSNKKRAYELFEYILELDTKCCFHFEVAADLFDEKTLLLLAKAPLGRIQFEIGLQSFFEQTLKACARKTNLKKAEQNIQTLLGYKNIHIHIDLIAGLPYEALEDFKKSFNRAYALKADVLQLGFLKLLHGSVLRSQAEEFGINYSKEPPYEITDNKWLTKADIKALKHTENALQHTYNKGRFLTAIKYVLTATGLTPYKFYYSFGKSFPNHGTQLELYAQHFFQFCKTLPNIDEDTLIDKLSYDWLCKKKKKNAPVFMKREGARCKTVHANAEKKLGQKLRKEEVLILHTGEIIFVNSENKNPVTGLYEVNYFYN